MTTSKVTLMTGVLQDVNVRIARQMRRVQICLFVGLAAAALSACGGSSEPTLQPVTVEPVTSEPVEGDADQAAAETPETVEATETVEAASPEDQLQLLESSFFREYAADAMGAEFDDLVPLDSYEIAGTGCYAKPFDNIQFEMDGNATHFAVTPADEWIVGSVEGAIQSVWSACYDSQGIQITSDQLVQLVVNFGEVRFARAEDESALAGFQRNNVDYEPASFVQDGDSFTFTVLVYSREFGDIYRVNVERTGDDMTVEYEELRRG